jgi:hypothetical protein
VDVGLVGAVALLFEADLLAGADFVRIAMSFPPGRLSGTSADANPSQCYRKRIVVAPLDPVATVATDDGDDCRDSSSAAPGSHARGQG